MTEQLSGFVYLVSFIVISFLANYHSDTNSSKTITGVLNLFGFILLTWWIVKFVLLGVFDSIIRDGVKNA